MSEAVVVGAGCIGRGFVAHLFSSAGWHVEAAAAVACEYDRPLGPILDLVDDLLARFGDPAIPDPVARVGRDPIRKTAPGDRIMGAYELARRLDVPVVHLSHAVSVGADALRRHQGWPADRILAHLRLSRVDPIEEYER